MTPLYGPALAAAASLLNGSVPRTPLTEPARPHVSARLISGAAALTPGPNEVGLHLVIEPGWHVYWDGLNDSGYPPTAEWTLPQGFKAGAIRWPAPARHVSPGDILDHVYEKEVTLIVPLDVPAGTTGAVTLSAKVAWLACKDVCVAEQQTVTLTLPVQSAGPAPAPSKDAPHFEKARARLPRPLPGEDPPVAFAWSEDRVEVRARGALGMAFYPARDCARLADPIRDAQSKGERLSLTFAHDRRDEPRRLRGVLEVTMSPSATAYYELDMPGTP